MAIGIRREDKNIWEKRVPIIPEHAACLLKKNGLKFIVQPSPIRIFEEAEYLEAGAEISEELSGADLILAVKEIPPHLIEENKTYIYFSHTIKGQPYNMKMLKTLMEKQCNLIDYERVVDQNNKRLIFFGKYAGKAGMVETFQALEYKLRLKGITNTFDKIKQPYQYDSIEASKAHLVEIGKEIKKNGIDTSLSPFVVGFSGYGNVSQGAQEMFDLLPFIELSPEELLTDYKSLRSERNNLFKVVFREEHMVKRKTGDFDRNEYFQYPENYESQFDKYIPYLTVLVNCILWSEKYPRLITKEYLKNNPDQKLLLIGDISCDINGSIEITTKPTSPAEPTFTYFPAEDRFEDDLSKDGITVMAIDNLPCEFPKDASTEFSNVLMTFLPDIHSTDFSKPFDELTLPEPIKRALILKEGKLTNEYHYMNQFLQRSHHG